MDELVTAELEMTVDGIEDEKCDDNSNSHSEEKLEAPVRGKIKLFDAIALIYGCIVGSGIFISVGPTFEICDSNSILIVLAVWFFGGVVALIGGFIYVELGMRVRKSGGERSFYSAALSPKFSVTFVWIYVYLVKTLTLSALAITASEYLVKTVLVSTQGVFYIQIMLGIVFILSCMLINSLSSKIATKSGTVLTIIKSVALIIVIVSGIVWLAKGNTKDWERPFDVHGFHALNLGIAFINVCWALEGWNSICFLLGEMKNPSKDLPKAMFGGIFSVLVFYLLTIVSYSAVLGFENVRNLDTLGVEFSVVVLKKAYPIIPLLVCFSALGALNGNLLSVSRVAMCAGQAGEIPRIFSLVHKKQRTPIFGIVTMSLISLFFLALDFQTILQSLAFVSWGFYFISGVCSLIMKFRPEFKTNQKIIEVPVFLVIFYQLVCVFMVVMSFYKKPLGCSLMLILILVIFFVQFIPSRFTKFPALQKLQSSSINFFQRNCNLVPADAADVGE